MKQTSLLLASVIIALSGCQTTGPTTTGPLISVSVTYATSKLVQKRPALADELLAAADALDTLSASVVNQETVLRILGDKVPADSPEARALVSLIGSYFPQGDAAIPISDELAALCKQIAAAVRLGLPASK